MGSASPRGRQVVRRLGRGGRQQGPSPRPSAPPGGQSPAARPTRGAPRQRPERPTWPCEGRRRGPPATRLAFMRLFGAPSREAGPAQRLPPPSSTPFQPPLSPIVVVPARAPRPRRHLPARSFADVELSLPSLLSALFFHQRKEKSSRESILRVET